MFKVTNGICIGRSLQAAKNSTTAISMTWNRFLRRAALSCLVLLMWQSNCFAWGAQGHRVIAQLAWERLNPKTRTQVEALLDGVGFEFVRDSDWADRIRGSARATAKWHYVDIPFSAESYEPRRDCPDNKCIVEVLERKIETLRSDRESAAVRAEALLFVIHFIGDIHQPLHCIDRDDKGGNSDKVLFGGRKTNLHAFWDQNLVAMQGRGTSEIVSKLSRAIRPGDAAAWGAGDMISWANETHDVARRSVYFSDIRPGVLTTLSEEYAASNSVVAAVQLQKAGIRLSWVLNHLWH